MQATVSPRRAERMGSTFRRFVRRGSRAHVVKLLARTRPEDVALQLQGLTPSESASVFKILITDFPDASGEVLASLEPADRSKVLEALGVTEIAQLLREMPVDDAVDVVESLPPELHERVLEIVDLRDLEQVQTHLTYGDDTAGRIMDTEFFSLPETTTVRQAISEIQEARHTENVFYLYVVDAEGRLSGVTSLRQLLLSRADQPLSEIMTRSVIRADTDTDQEEVARLANRYDLLAIPITDSENHLLGIVTADDIIDVFKEEATEDFYKMVGSSDDELVYQDRSLKVFGIRFPWLAVNLVGLGVAGLLIHWFELRLEEALFLLPFVPVVMGMGGNIGAQTSMITVRGLATGRLSSEAREARRFLWQQVKVGGIIGAACAVLAAAAAWLLPQWGWLQLDGGPWATASYAAVVGVSLFLAIVLASVNGALVPLVFSRLGIDPAVASGPLVTTSNDISGILIYFGMASILIDWMVV